MYTSTIYYKMLCHYCLSKVIAPLKTLLYYGTWCSVSSMHIRLY